MLQLPAALAVVNQTLAAIALPSERVAVADALERTLVTDQVSHLNLPPFNKSAMDGYAIPAGQRCGVYRILETVAAGSVPTSRLLPGTAVKVMTGAPVPEGTGQVVKVEEVELQGECIKVVEPGGDRNLCLLGEDARRGDVILSAGTRLTPLDVANLISCGITEVDVFRRLRVAILPTGDELADHPGQLRPGMIINSNGPLLLCLARQYAMEPVLWRVLRDDRATIAAAIRGALEEADMVVLSGGVSVGDFDCVTPALEDAGLHVHFTAVAIKPGRPTTYASAGGKAVFGLPGNPVAVYLTFHLFVLHAARMMGGGRPLRELQLPLHTPFRRRNAARREYVPCRLQESGRLQPVAFHGSAHLMALTQADGFLIVPEGVTALEAGQVASFLPVKAFPQ